MPSATIALAAGAYAALLLLLLCELHRTSDRHPEHAEPRSHQ
jgi:hypothetical protein